MDPYLKIRTKSAVGAQKRAIPRVTTAERLRIALDVSDGEILVYDTDLGQYFVVTSSSNASFAPSALTADVPGRAVMSDGYFNEATVLAKFAAGFLFGGTLSGTKNLLVTGTAATGGGTGAVAITILALPAA